MVLVAIDPKAVSDRLRTIHKCISGLQVSHAGINFTITCSLGVVQLAFSKDDDGIVDQKLVLSAADEALYEAKRAGRNRFVFVNVNPSH